MSGNFELATLVDVYKLNKKRRREESSFGESHYRDHFRIFCDELIKAGGSVDEFKQITNAYFSAKIISRDVLFKNARKDRLNIMANNPAYPDDKMVTSVDESDLPNIVVAKTREEFIRIFTCAQKVHSVLEAGVPPMEGQSERIARMEADHEGDHAKAFVNEPEAKVMYSIIFYKDRKARQVDLYPALAISGQYSLGSYRRCFEVKNPSGMDLAMSEKPL